jgi:hypothetical protein
MRRPRGSRALPLLVGAVALLAAACGDGGGGTSDAAGAAGGEMSLAIATPADGASVTEPFTLKVSSSVPLGEPDSGRHHLHIWFDGQEADYQINYTDSFQVEGLPAGEHVLTAALANADHSLAGPRSEITVTVGGGDDGATATTSSQDGGPAYP